MENCREIIQNSSNAYANFKKNVDSGEVIKAILNLIEESLDSIKEASEIDSKNDNGFVFQKEIFEKLKAKVENSLDLYRNVISLKKDEKNNYLIGKQTDSLGTICVVYNGNTYYMLEMILKCILTHNAVVFVSDSNYMDATNGLILTLVKRILNVYNISEFLVQMVYTTKLQEILSNKVTIKKVVVIGNRVLQENVKKIAKSEVICFGFNNYELYIDDDAHIDLIKKIIDNCDNIDVYVKEGLESDFENIYADFIEVSDVDEAIFKINVSGSGESCAIFTDKPKRATRFLEKVKCKNIGVNSSPINSYNFDFDISQLIMVKSMFYPSPLCESTDKNKFEYSIGINGNTGNLKNSVDNSINSDNAMTESIEEIRKENAKLKSNIIV